MPASILRELMRHESVQTTEDYYVGVNAQTMANVLIAAGNVVEVDEVRRGLN